uniref:Rieske domain-containing protein n=1 Tax=Arcella intermedia TaxID=1963864 RepID=A0A6B2L1K3_9EUKA
MLKECTLGALDKKVLLVKEGDQINAFGAKCSHAKALLKTGTYFRGRVRCSLHGACFSVKTGDIEDYPACDGLPVFPVRVENGKVLVTIHNEADLQKSAVTKKMAKLDSNDKRVFVIIGGGPAGATAAETLRAEGFTGRVVLINKEKHLAYDRTKYSKIMNSPLDKTLLRNEEFYKNNDIECLLGAEVVDLNPETKTVQLESGKSIQFDQVLIATGADCQRLAFIPGYDGANVHVLRTHEDGHRIWNESKGKNVLIVGSSFIGMEVASCIVDHCKVTVIGMEPVPFERVLGKDVGALMQKYHEAKGVKFILNAICKEFVRKGDTVVSVILKDGTQIDDVDMIVLGAGVVPATGFLKHPSVQLGRDKSVLVDKYLSTGLEGVWAAGDLARYPFSMLEDELVRIEHYGMAQTQGAIAAKNMLAGGPKYPCNNVPFFWTSQYGKSVRYCGHALSYNEVILDNLDSDVSSKNFGYVAYYVHKEKVLAVCSMNRDPIVAQVAELMNADIPIYADELKKYISADGTADQLIKKKLTSTF